MSSKCWVCKGSGSVPCGSVFAPNCGPYHPDGHNCPRCNGSAKEDKPHKLVAPKLAPHAEKIRRAVGKKPEEIENSDTSLMLLNEIAELMGLPPGNARDRARPILSLITQETTKARREELERLAPPSYHGLPTTDETAELKLASLESKIEERLRELK